MIRSELRRVGQGGSSRLLPKRLTRKDLWAVPEGRLLYELKSLPLGVLSSKLRQVYCTVLWAELNPRLSIWVLNLEFYGKEDRDLNPNLENYALLL